MWRRRCSDSSWRRRAGWRAPILRQRPVGTTSLALGRLYHPSLSAFWSSCASARDGWSSWPNSGAKSGGRETLAAAILANGSCGTPKTLGPRFAAAADSGGSERDQQNPPGAFRRGRAMPSMLPPRAASVNNEIWASPDPLFHLLGVDS